MHEYLDYANLSFLNLKILKFEARCAYAVKFWTDFFDLKSAKFSPYDILSKAGNLLLFQCTRNNLLDIFILQGLGNKKSRSTFVWLIKIAEVVSKYTKIDTDTNEYLDYKN